MSDDKEKSSLKVDVGASAKLEVKTEIPSSSSGRLLDTLTDIIRPFSESRGLRADQIRLQREDVLIEIARKAKERLAIENAVPQPLPNKFMVPFLEKASLEDMDSEMIDRWADLLASASQDPKGAHPKFVQILSELTGREVALLRMIALNGFEECEFPLSSLRRSGSIFFLKEEVRNIIRTKLIEEGALDRISNPLHLPGVCLIQEMYINDDFVGCNTAMPAAPLFKRLIQLQEPNIGGLSLDVLRSLKVIDRVVIQEMRRETRVKIVFVYLTSLGVELLEKCDKGLIAELNVKEDASRQQQFSQDS